MGEIHSSLNYNCSFHNAQVHEDLKALLCIKLIETK